MMHRPAPLSSKRSKRTAFTTLILDAPGPPLLFEEVDRFLELGLVVTLNLYYFADKHSIRQHYGERLRYTEINGHDRQAS